MRKIRSKKGVSTMFLAITVSALILLETTYVAFVADLDRRLTYERAVRLQMESFMARYNRELLKTYGLYAFDMNGLDDNVYRSVLAQNGIDEGVPIVVSGMNSFDEDDLRSAVTVFYTYRSSGILFSYFSEQIEELIEQLDETGMITGIREFMSSDASDVIVDIINGASKITEALETIAELVNQDDIAEKISSFNVFCEDLRDFFDSPPDTDRTFDPTDDNMLTDIITGLESFMETGSDATIEPLFHSYLSNYAVYNFDCRLEEDTTINGREFSVFHEGNLSDSEFILTGIAGTGGELLIAGFIFNILLLDNVVMLFANSDQRRFIEDCAEILKLVVDIVTLGTVDLPSEVYCCIIALSIALRLSALKLLTVEGGGAVTLFEYLGTDIFELGYRDFLSMYAFYIPDNMLLSRMVDILERDFPDHSVSVCLEAEYRGEMITFENEYELY